MDRSQNRSHAVMSQRHEGLDSLDNFPTPPWATRALFETLGKHGIQVSGLSCWEPACGAGHMARPLEEYFAEVRASDIYDYGYGETQDFLFFTENRQQPDWIVTNPPFRLAEDFIVHALSIANIGVAVLARTVFLESKKRYNALFQDRPPTYFLQFVERVPMVKGRLDRTASTATGYAWFVWIKGREDGGTRLLWIPPLRRTLETDKDYIKS